MAKWSRYQQSKLANILFTYALQERAEKHGSKVKVLVAHPGATLTDLQMKTARTTKSVIDAYLLNSFMEKAHSEEDGCQGSFGAVASQTSKVDSSMGRWADWRRCVVTA